MALSEKFVINDLRTSLRINEKLPVRWRIDKSSLSGEGKVLNLSTSGLLLEMNNVDSSEEALFNLEPLHQNGLILPPQGRVVWSKVKRLSNKKLCGIEFVDPSPEAVANLREKIQKGIIKVASERRWRSVVGTILVIAMLALTAITVKQHVENYQNTMEAEQMMVGAYDQQVALTKKYSDELTTTKNLLVEAQTALEQARIQISQLTDQNSSFKQTISNLETKNTELSTELAAVQARLSFLEGNVKDLAEAKALIMEYKGKFKLVKGKISAFNHEAWEAKVAAQKEKDRIAMLMGNNGFLMKDGKPNIKEASAVEGSAVPAENAGKPASEKRIRVDVEVTK